MFLLTALPLVVSLLPTPATAFELAGSSKPSPADLQAPARGAALPVLYISFAALQAYDATATLRVVSTGGVEINPMMAGVSRNPAAMWTVKAAVTTGAIIASERLWRSHRRTQAIVLMAVANAVMTGVAIHNAPAMNGVR